MYFNQSNLPKLISDVFLWISKPHVKKILIDEAGRAGAVTMGMVTLDTQFDPLTTRAEGRESSNVWTTSASCSCLINDHDSDLKTAVTEKEEEQMNIFRALLIGRVRIMSWACIKSIEERTNEIKNSLGRQVIPLQPIEEAHPSLDGFKIDLVREKSGYKLTLTYIVTLTTWGFWENHSGIEEKVIDSSVKPRIFTLPEGPTRSNSILPRK